MTCHLVDISNISTNFFLATRSLGSHKSSPRVCSFTNLTRRFVRRRRLRREARFVLVVGRPLITWVGRGGVIWGLVIWGCFYRIGELEWTAMRKKIYTSDEVNAVLQFLKVSPVKLMIWPELFHIIKNCFLLLSLRLNDEPKHPIFMDCAQKWYNQTLV